MAFLNVLQLVLSSLLATGLLAAPQEGSTTGSQPEEGSTTTSSCREPGVEYPIGIDFEELKAATEAKTMVLVDVREPWELEQIGRIPTSVNLPLGFIDTAFQLTESEFEAQYGFSKPQSEDTNIVLTCRSGRRARVAWYKIEPLGYCNVRVYFGSYLDWKANNGTLLYGTVPGSNLGQSPPREAE